MDENQQIPTSLISELKLAWDPREPAISEQRFRRILEDNINNFSFSVEIMTQIARAKSAQGQVAEAKNTLKQAEELRVKHCPENASATTRCLIETARIFIIERTPARAHPLLSTAWTHAVNGDLDYYVVEIANLMAAIEPQKSREKWILKGIEVAEKSPHAHTQSFLSELYSLLGWIYSEMRQHEKAYATLELALRACEKSGKEKEIILSKSALGKILRLLKKPEEALVIQKNLLEQAEENGEVGGSILEEIGECLLALEQAEDAAKYFERAYLELSSSEWLRDNQPQRLKRIKNLGKVK